MYNNNNNNRNISIIRPDYYNEFRCIGGECKNSCCKGWDIYVDKKTYTKYKSISSTNIKDKARINIKRARALRNDKSYAKINMVNGACPFLDTNELCEIHKELGGDALCNTCKAYPRIHREYGNQLVSGLTLSCEEASKLVLTRGKITFVEENPTKFDLDMYASRGMFPKLHGLGTEVWITMIDIIQNEAYCIEDRLLVIGVLLENLFKTNSSDELLSLLANTRSELENKEFDSIINTTSNSNVENSYKVQHELFKTLTLTRFSGLGKSYLDCVSTENIIHNLGLSDDVDNFSQGKFEELSERFKRFNQDNKLVLENYFVNYIVQTFFPFHFKEIDDAFLSLVLRYSLIKIFSYSYLVDNEEIKLDDMVEIVRNIERGLGHGKVLGKMSDILKSHNFSVTDCIPLFI